MSNLKYIGKNILNHELEVKSGNIIGDHTEVIRVTVVSDGGNKYAFEGATTPDFTIDEGKTYRFDQSDSTNETHPLRFSIVENGTWGGGSAYTTGVTTHGTAGFKGAYTEINVTKVTPNHLYYYCVNHSGMGNDALLLKNDFSNLYRISGSDATVNVSQVTASGVQVNGNVTVNDDILVGEYIRHKGDLNTRIYFTDDRLRFQAGGIDFVGMHKKSSAPHLVTINNGSNNIDFQIKDNDGDTLFKTDASADNVLFPDAVKISGSAASTGSFGFLEASNILFESDENGDIMPL